MYDYSRNQEVAKRAEQKAKRSMQMNYMIVLACIMLFLLLSYIYRKQLALKKKKIAVSKLLYEDSLLKLKRLQDEKAKLVSENDNKLVQIITEKEKTINKLKASSPGKVEQSLIIMPCLMARSNSICASTPSLSILSR